eukprot:403365890
MSTNERNTMMNEMIIKQVPTSQNQLKYSENNILESKFQKENTEIKPQQSIVKAKTKNQSIRFFSDMKVQKKENRRVISTKQNQQVYQLILRLLVDSWFWDKESAHRLFNFHEGFKTDKSSVEVIGTSTIHQSQLLYMLGGIINDEKQISKINSVQLSKFKDTPVFDYDGEEPDVIKQMKSKRLINVVFNNGNYYVGEQPQRPIDKTEAYDTNLWLMPKYMPKKEIEVKEGDIIRMGRIPFKIKKLMLDLSNKKNNEDSRIISIDDSRQNLDQSVNQDLSQDAFMDANRGVNSSVDKRLGGARDSASSKLESGRNCRICLDDTETEENPFITPCKCSGSMKFIHLQCLREWLDSKRVSQKLEGIYSYYWEELACELCKEALELTKNDFYIGRRVSNDITISDISVSRQQSAIKLREGKVYVSDCDSKFGTFVKIQEPMRVPSDFTLPLQTERKCFFVRLVNRFSCWMNCITSCGLVNRLETYDHYQDVSSKLPHFMKQYFDQQNKNNKSSFDFSAINSPKLKSNITIRVQVTKETAFSTKPAINFKNIKVITNHQISLRDFLPFQRKAVTRISTITLMENQAIEFTKIQNDYDNQQSDYNQSVNHPPYQADYDYEENQTEPQNPHNESISDKQYKFQDQNPSRRYQSQQQSQQHDSEEEEYYDQEDDSESHDINYPVHTVGTQSPNQQHVLQSIDQSDDSAINKQLDRNNSEILITDSPSIQSKTHEQLDQQPNSNNSEIFNKVVQLDKGDVLFQSNKQFRISPQINKHSDHEEVNIQPFKELSQKKKDLKIEIIEFQEDKPQQNQNEIQKDVKTLQKQLKRNSDFHAQQQQKGNNIINLIDQSNLSDL